MENITPTNYLAFARSEDEWKQQAAFIFCLLSQGRKATKVAEVVNQLSDDAETCMSMLSYIGWIHDDVLVDALTPLGLQNQLSRKLRFVAEHFTHGGVGPMSLKMLLSVPYVGLKIAAMILRAFDTDCSLAVLDTHMLKYLGTKGWIAPRKTPTSRVEYEEWSAILIDELKAEYPTLSYEEADLEVWKKMSNYDERN